MKTEFNNTILVIIGEYRLRFHATEHPQAGKVYGYQLEQKSYWESPDGNCWCLLDDDGEEMDAIPESIKDDFRTICSAFGRVW